MRKPLDLSMEDSTSDLDENIMWDDECWRRICGVAATERLPRRGNGRRMRR